MGTQRNITMLGTLAAVAAGLAVVTTDQWLPAGPAPIALMIILGGLGLLAWRGQLPVGDWYLRSLVLGALLIGIPGAMFLQGAPELTGAGGLLLVGAFPFTLAMLGQAVSMDRAGVGPALGGVLALLGAIWLAGPGLVTPADVAARGIVAVVCLGVGSALHRRWAAPADLWALVAWELVAGGLVMLPFALGGAGLPDGVTGWAMTLVQVLILLLVVWAWTRVLQRLDTGAAVASACPAVVAAGVVVASGTADRTLLAALVLMLLGVVLAHLNLQIVPADAVVVSDRLPERPNRPSYLNLRGQRARHLGGIGLANGEPQDVATLPSAEEGWAGLLGQDQVAAADPVLEIGALELRGAQPQPALDDTSRWERPVPQHDETQEHMVEEPQARGDLTDENSTVDQSSGDSETAQGDLSSVEEPPAAEPSHTRVPVDLKHDAIAQWLRRRSKGLSHLDDWPDSDDATLSDLQLINLQLINLPPIKDDTTYEELGPERGSGLGRDEEPVEERAELGALEERAELGALEERAELGALEERAEQGALEEYAEQGALEEEELWGHSVGRAATVDKVIETASGLSSERQESGQPGRTTAPWYAAFVGELELVGHENVASDEMVGPPPQHSDGQEDAAAPAVEEAPVHGTSEEFEAVPTVEEPVEDEAAEGTVAQALEAAETIDSDEEPEAAESDSEQVKVEPDFGESQAMEPTEPPEESLTVEVDEAPEATEVDEAPEATEVDEAPETIDADGEAEAIGDEEAEAIDADGEPDSSAADEEEEPETIDADGEPDSSDADEEEEPETIDADGEPDSSDADADADEEEEAERPAAIRRGQHSESDHEEDDDVPLTIRRALVVVEEARNGVAHPTVVPPEVSHGAQNGVPRPLSFIDGSLMLALRHDVLAELDGLFNRRMATLVNGHEADMAGADTAGVQAPGSQRPGVPADAHPAGSRDFPANSYPRLSALLASGHSAGS